VNASAAPAERPAQCDHCKEYLGDDRVHLWFEGERGRAFCTTGCEVAWLSDRYEVYRSALRRIYLTLRGRAYDVARRALYGTEPA
jgi:hypothetical protein